jgi:hypothetical protein
MENKTKNLAEGLAEQIKRNQDLLEMYKEIGPAGVFGYTLIKQDVNEALDAQASGDVIRILQAYKKLEGNE